MVLWAQPLLLLSCWCPCENSSHVISAGFVAGRPGWSYYDQYLTGWQEKVINLITLLHQCGFIRESYHVVDKNMVKHTNCMMERNMNNSKNWIMSVLGVWLFMV